MLFKNFYSGNFKNYKMKVRIICYEDPDFWILGKFAKQLNKNLLQLGIQSDIDNKPDNTADINHHIIYNNFNGEISKNDTLMITHVDNIDKLNLLKKNIVKAQLGICMSSETMFSLSDSGIDKQKLCYILPSHDQVVQIKKIAIGIFCRVQPDGRTREYFLERLINNLNSKLFKFIIMGDSWDPQVNKLHKSGFEVEYYNTFNLDVYYKLFQKLDYYLYMGMDEGQMGVLDAHAAGIKTIVTKQGYHLDLNNSVTHYFSKYDELLSILMKIQSDKEILLNSVSQLTWIDYTKKHIECWNYILSKKQVSSIYTDGYNSISRQKVVMKNYKISKLKLVINKYLHYYFLVKKRIFS